ncbi:MAG TPA: thiamine phosphate synthase [Caulobacteraceae bacterium]
MSSDSLSGLWRTARTLGRRSRAEKPLPALLFFTDPVRTPRPESVLQALPPGAGVVFRPFGARGALEQGRRLRAIATRRRLVFLVGADPRLAAALRADGVHLPERLAHLALGIRRAHPRWLVTTAAHSLSAAIAARRGGAQAVVISPVFPSISPSAGRALGPLRFAAIARAGGLPAYALGGVNARTARRLRLGPAIGIAAIEGILEEKAYRPRTCPL